MRRVTIRLRDDQYVWLRAEARRTGRSMSAIVRDAIDRYLASPTNEQNRIEGAET
jgi:predicted DNA-binding protein